MTVPHSHTKFNSQGKTQNQLDALRECGDCPGIDGYLPNIVIDSMALKVRSDTFEVPHELTEDILNPHIGPTYVSRAFSIDEKQYGVDVMLSGGDGSGAYKVTFKIDLIDMQVTRSVFQHPDFDEPTVKKADIK